MVGAVRVRKSSAAQQAIQILSDRIRSGEYAPESRLPSEDALGLELGVSRTTIRSALEHLAAQNLVRRRHGGGTFVSGVSAIANPLNQAVLFQDLIRESGHEPDIHWLATRVIHAHPDLAESLQLEAGDQVLEVRKEFTADAEPVIFCTNFVPAWVLGAEMLAEVLAEPTIEEPVFAFLAGRCGHPINYFVASICPELIADIDFDCKTLDPAAPALVIDEVGYDDQERALLRSIHHYPGKHMSFAFIRRFQGDVSSTI
jgi:GntR family transcriptional regulator